MREEQLPAPTLIILASRVAAGTAAPSSKKADQRYTGKLHLATMAYKIWDSGDDGRV